MSPSLPSSASAPTRRMVLGGLIALGAGAALPGSALAASPVVVGRIRDTYLAAGGRDVLGRPLRNEVRIRIDGRNTYGQVFERGSVWWGSGAGKVDLPRGTRVRLDAAPNFRPVLGVRGVWRTDDLDGCTPLDERVVRDLGITTSVAMNSGSDPTIRGVSNLRYRISNSGSHLEFYRGYVTRSASRAAVGKVLNAVATSPGPVLVHCSAGKDRTGWVSDLLQALVGVPLAQRNAGYLATTTYSGADVDLKWLQAARDQLAADYGSLESYLTRGCGLSRSGLATLRARLTGG